MGGVEKASLRVGVLSIAERTAGLLSDLCASVLVATPRPEPWAALPVRVVGDEVPAAGPLAGIAAGLAASPSAWVLAVAGDMPLLDGRLLARLCARALATGRPVIPLVNGHPEPLHAVYRAADAARARRALEAGVGKAWGWLDPGEVEWADAASLRAGAALSFRSVNTPEELRDARRAVDAAAARGDTSGA
jgi:molybdenum cofactor guanylyltransferase